MAAIDGIVVFLAGVIIYLLYVGANSQSAITYASACAVTALIIVGACYISGLYEFDSAENRGKRLIKIVVGCWCAFLVIVTLAFALKISAEFSRVWLFSWFIASTLLIVLRHSFGHSELHRLTMSGQLSRNVVIVGATELAKGLIKCMENRKNPGVCILGIFEDRKNRGSSDICQYSILGNLDNLIDLAQTHRIDDVIIALPWRAENRLLGIIEKLEVLPICLCLCPDILGYDFVQHRYNYLCGVPVLTVFQKPVCGSGWSFGAKLIEDRLLAALFLFMMLPVMGFIVLCIKLDSPGPVFFRQKRHGFNNQVIDVLKFRTLRSEQQDDLAKQLVTRNDPRVTRVGRFLRQMSLDELPQLLNVLTGEMSIVGPRPHAPNARAGGRLYKEVVEKYAVRHKVKPGMTGWAQVNGWRGETDTEEKIRKRVEHDLYYIKNWSLTLDLIIIFRTPWALLKGRNSAY